MKIPGASHYWLKNAHVPFTLIQLADGETIGESELLNPIEPLLLLDIEIRDGVIHSLQQSATVPDEIPSVDLQRGMVWPCFVDLHTHLDKGHTWGRSPNLAGTFDSALALVSSDREKHWDAEDVYRRMEFGLKCSYAHGTRALRTHIDSANGQAKISLEVFKALKAEWQGRLELQAVSLVPLDYFMGAEGEVLADQIAEAGGCLGGLPLMNEDLERQIDRVFELAGDRQLNLDFHTDESGNPADITLRHIAAATLRHEFTGRVVCGHCCSLSVQPAEEVQKTIDLVKQARIGIVSLPMCNLYLQDRNQQTSQHFLYAPLEQQLAFNSKFPSRTPRWRGVTLLHELKHSGVPTAVASDNCRDPFHAFGDHDVLEVFTQSAKIAHFNAAYGDWCTAVTTTPADLMGFPTIGRIGTGLPADLILFRGRYFSELLSRSQHDRVVLRQGKAIDTALPDYAELDDLLVK
ncbi:cytosine deaminase [Cyanobacteria bacterium FACHB-471]|nr:cytosine deaminase [Cyanobacteria bacterium FACHB-471]